ncbi:MAG: hypothetical protein HYZ75_16940 [Elusimicrobia bacterium]|nr:hypothetical protein [Elusimicrobiota bacterium]
MKIDERKVLVSVWLAAGFASPGAWAAGPAGAFLEQARRSAAPAITALAVQQGPAAGAVGGTPAPDMPGRAGPDGKEHALQYCRDPLVFPKEKYRQTCAVIVHGAAFFEPALIDYCRGFKYQWYKIYCVDQGRNSRFPQGALSDCAQTSPSGAAGDRTRLECLLSVARPEERDVYSQTKVVQAANHSNFGVAHRWILYEAALYCRGWDRHHFVDENWHSNPTHRQDACWRDGNGASCAARVYCSRKQADNQQTILYSGWIE